MLLRSPLYSPLAGKWGSPASILLGNEPAGAAFDFTDMDMVIRGGGLDWAGDLNGKLTYTSPSTKWVRNASGIYISGTTLRCDHLADGTALGLLPEGQFTNVLLRSQEFDTSWAKTDITVTANATTSPDGTANADLITEGTAGTASIRQTGTATTASVAVCGAISIKASANNTWARVSLLDATSATGVHAWVNLSTGALGTVDDVGTATSVGARVVADANGFWRVGLWATFQSGVADARLSVQSADADNSATRVNSSAYYLWQADAGLGARPSSPVVTTTAAVTRSADDIRLALGSMLGSEFSFLIKYRSAKTGGAAVAGGVSNTASPTFNNTAYVSNDSVLTNRGNTVVRSGGSSVANMVKGSTNQDGLIRVAARFKADDFRIAVDGELQTADTSGAMPATAMDRFVFGSSPWAPTNNSLASHIESVVVVPRAWSDSEIQARST